MNVVYRVDLTAEECDQLSSIVASKAGAQKRKRAQILLAAAKGMATSPSRRRCRAVCRRSTERRSAS